MVGFGFHWRRKRRKMCGRREAFSRGALRPRQGAEEGRRRLARGPEHMRPGLQGARPLRTLVGAGGEQLERQRESVEGRREAALRVRGIGAEARWRRRASEACARVQMESFAPRFARL